jgi:hypothetical protein
VRLVRAQGEVMGFPGRVVCRRKLVFAAQIGFSSRRFHRVCGPRPRSFARRAARHPNRASQQKYKSQFRRVRLHGASVRKQGSNVPARRKSNALNWDKHRAHNGARLFASKHADSNDLSSGCHVPVPDTTATQAGLRPNPRYAVVLSEVGSTMRVLR